jgi:hypothetical protein
MLENLINLIREQAGDAVINNSAIPNEQNEAVIAQAGQSVTGGLQSLISQGNIQQLLSLFQGNSASVQNHPAVQNMSTGFIGQLMEKFGLNQSAAAGVASGLIPNVLQSLVQKTNDPSDSSFTLDGIVSHLGGSGGIQGLLGGLTGQQTESTGILNKVKELFS